MRRGLRRGYSLSTTTVSRYQYLTVLNHAYCREPVQLREHSILAEYEVQCDLSIHLDRFAVENVRPVPPLAHRLKCCRNQHGMACDQSQVLDRSVLTYHRGQDNGALNSCIPCQRRIHRLHAPNQTSFQHARRPECTRNCKRGNWGNRSCSCCWERNLRP